VPKTLRVSDANQVPLEGDVHSIRDTDPRAVTSRVSPITVGDELSRNVFGLLGVPLDALNFATLLRAVEGAVETSSRFLISTPNVNFLVKSHQNSQFRESLLLSDLCLVDGMPLIWIAKLLRIPIYERIAGADLFGRLKSADNSARRLKVFLVGGADGVAATVCAKLNSERSGLECVGVLNPGFGTIDEMSSPKIIETINASHADLIAVFFGAEKAQSWLMQNHHRLCAPVRAQFGATINFEAGTVKRAPHFMRSTGFEWLWRIKEEPYLWRRYWNDGMVLLQLMMTCVLPLAVNARRRRSKSSDLFVSLRETANDCVVELAGDAIDPHVEQALCHFRSALQSAKQIVVDISKTRDIDPRFFGLFLMVRKQLASQGRCLVFAGAPDDIKRLFKLNKFEFLLSS
jgi:N-acetylglucosaminyldiphosphoundecaprenol N-acetyl-beta-D-mannosaminyltransferase